MGYNPKVYRKQGGSSLVVASGGTIAVETGGTITYNGDDLIAEIAALSGLDSGELGVLNSVTAGTVAASKAVIVDASKFLDWAVSSASTDGGVSVEPLNFDVTMTGVGGVGGRAKFTLTTNVALGSWSNALKAQVTYGASGRTTGLGSAFVAEMTLSAGTSAGTYAPIEVELNLATGALTGTATSFFYAQVNGADAGTFDTNGYILDIAGVTVNANKVFQASAVTGVNSTHALRIRVAGTPYFIPLHTSAGFGG